MPHLEVFYTSPDQIDTNTGVLKISDQEAHHIINVLRHKPGDKIVVVNGCGQAYWVTLTVLSKGIVTGTIEKEEQSWGESSVPIGVIIPPLKGQRMDTVIEKGTELGATWFMIPHTHNTVATATPNKLDRWKRIALAAMKQCGRSVWPAIRIFPNFNSALIACLELDVFEFKDTVAQHSTDTRSRADVFYADMDSTNSFRNWFTDSDNHRDSGRTFCIAVGPEGGFSEEEVQEFARVGAKAFTLGPRRLRSDTAIITVLALIAFMRKQL
ncbi:hypothetical protein AMJ86_01520 [bacterium SM23_57]|nr:MAG: hypothetical protein AMJ86_01520 [bacterium SM23_57]